MQFTAARTPHFLPPLCASPHSPFMQPRRRQQFPQRPWLATIGPQPDGLTLHLDSGDLRIQLLSDSVVRVAFARSAISSPAPRSMSFPSLPYHRLEAPNARSFVLTTARLHVIVIANPAPSPSQTSPATPSSPKPPAAARRSPPPYRAKPHSTSSSVGTPSPASPSTALVRCSLASQTSRDTTSTSGSTMNIVVPFLVSLRGYGNPCDIYLHLLRRSPPLRRYPAC